MPKQINTLFCLTSLYIYLEQILGGGFRFSFTTNSYLFPILSEIELLVLSASAAPLFENIDEVPSSISYAGTAYNRTKRNSPAGGIL